MKLALVLSSVLTAGCNSQSLSVATPPPSLAPFALGTGSTTIASSQPGRAVSVPATVPYRYSIVVQPTSDGGGCAWDARLQSAAGGVFEIGDVTHSQPANQRSTVLTLPAGIYQLVVSELGTQASIVCSWVVTVTASSEATQTAKT